MIIRKFGTDYIRTNGRKPHLRFNCPFCEKRRGKSDSDKKLYVNINTSKFYCFKCEASGSLASTRSRSVYGVYNEISSLFKDNVEDNLDEETEDNMFYIPNVKIPVGSIAYSYCRSRGITEDIINYYNIRLGVGELYGRIVIPNILYYNGEWTDMYSSRTYIDQIPKYLNPPGAVKTNSVFNLHRIEDGCDNLYIQEGVITSIKAGKDSVALYGCHPSENQIKSIVSKNAKNIYVSLDNDAAGRIPNKDLAEVLTKLCKDSNVYYVYLPEGIDAADLGEESYKKYVKYNCNRCYGEVYEKLLSLIE